MPALTTLRMPIAEIVGHAVAQAINLVCDGMPEVTGPELTAFEPTLVVRDSTAAPWRED